MAKHLLSLILINQKLKEAVYDFRETLLLSEGSILTEESIKFLFKNGIEEVVIDDPTSLPVHTSHTELDITNCVERYKAMYQRVRLGDNLIYSEIKDIVEPILEDVQKDERTLQLLFALEHLYRYEYEHSIRVSAFAGLLAKWAGYDADIVSDTVFAGVMHDIGKTNIPDDILDKPGSLTEEEMEMMKEHAYFSYVLTKNLYFNRPNVLEGIRNHHERMDGSGYMQGLRAPEIGIVSRMIAIADVFAAMTQNRAYSKAKTPFVAFEELLTESLDKNLVSIFLDRVTSYFLNVTVRLSDGEIGEVVHINKRKPGMPIVSVDDVYIDLSVEPNRYITAVL